MSCYHASAGVVFFNPLRIFTASDIADPGPVVKVPGNGPAQAVLKPMSLLPAQFIFYLVAVDGVATVVTGPVANKGDKLFVVLSFEF